MSDRTPIKGTFLRPRSRRGLAATGAFALNILLLIAVLSMWVASTLTKFDFAINDDKLHYVYFEFHAMLGAFYMGYQRGGIGYVPFWMPALLLSIWPCLFLYKRL